MKHSKKIIFSSVLGSIAVFSTSVALISKSCPSAPETKPEEKIKYQEKLGLKIADKTTKKEEETHHFVHEAKEAKTLEDIKKVLTKFNIAFDFSGIPEGATYKVADSTHDHADQGMVHLDITQTINGRETTERFEIIGFEIEKVPEHIKIGGYTLATKAKKEWKKTVRETAEELKTYKDKSFEELLTFLKQIVEIKEPESEEEKKLQFKFDLEHLHIHAHHEGEGEIIFEKTFVFNKDKPTETTELKEKYRIHHLK
ncbi:hypothetical protein PT313_03080 [Metamycoplasma hyosynoviae]|uniref:Lipoprotein n=1 Tax=Metamycoplasma hyosynoviae TaxID=29559 RepID=A0AAP4AK16_9BACT|nr:hypothetical protein [Metamycoplasma hyosynoviae]MDC8918298.1 hypothetical protein [Metamycoplasma hyosynoviae]MDD1372974.1 hypothetical protein [Metamycoplasma hyosynoviae]MDD1374558.1 hypothetical protein [Metamycoplasma hyosynoviae]MDD7893268.1 hypothetical protein [Metamycoplasma hyosynoviae]MDD7895343.1 hypothetical protein [Metamycoplasma hyosynoviae]